MANEPKNTEKESNKRDPDTAPARILLGAVLGALRAGVPYEKLISSLEFAYAAKGYKAPIWRAAADSLNEAATQVQQQGTEEEYEPDRRFAGDGR